MTGQGEGTSGWLTGVMDNQFFNRLIKLITSEMPFLQNRNTDTYAPSRCCKKTPKTAKTKSSTFMVLMAKANKIRWKTHFRSEAVTRNSAHVRRFTENTYRCCPDGIYSTVTMAGMRKEHQSPPSDIQKYPVLCELHSWFKRLIPK